MGWSRGEGSGELTQVQRIVWEKREPELGEETTVPETEYVPDRERREWEEGAVGEREFLGREPGRECWEKRSFESKWKKMGEMEKEMNLSDDIIK